MIENWAKVGNAVTGLKAPWPEVISSLKKKHIDLSEKSQKNLPI